MYTYFKTGTPTCRSACAQVASIWFQDAYKKSGYMKHGIATLHVCAADTFLNLITMDLFRDNNKVAITIHVILVSGKLTQLGFSLAVHDEAHLSQQCTLASSCAPHQDLQ